MRGVRTSSTSVTTVWVFWVLKLLSTLKEESYECKDDIPEFYHHTWDWYWALRAEETAVSIWGWSAVTIWLT